jgi:hypothetical protein
LQFSSKISNILKKAGIMKFRDTLNHLSRRNFCKTFAIGSLISSLHFKSTFSQNRGQPDRPETNIKDALSYPRQNHSLPGLFPGRVVNVYHGGSIINNKADFAVTYRMLSNAMQALTGSDSIEEAWQKFVTPDDIIGLKVNPVAGKLLSTSLEITESVIQQLEKSGIPRKNIKIWDRREFQLYEAGFTAANFPGIKIEGTEKKDEHGSFYDHQGKLFSEKMIDREWYFWAKVSTDYDSDTLPYMINQGEYSYFSKIVTQELTKIINIPILKNAGPTVTLCLKNLAYGSISNTARLHQQLWSETCAQVPCFAPLRDKVVLNIVDVLRGCYDGGPAASPQFFTDYNRILVGTDPVAVDRIGYQIVLNKRLEKKIQEEESPLGIKFLEMAESYGLGIAQLNSIDHQELNMK